MKWKRVFWLAAIFILTWNILFQENIYSEPIGKFMRVSREKMKAKYGWIPFGSGVSYPGGVLKDFKLCFQVVGPKSQEEIREMLVEEAENMLADLKEAHDVHTDLERTPPDEKHFSIVLFFIDKQGYTLREPFIGVAGYRYGLLTYQVTKQVYNKSLKRDMPKTVWEVEETFEEAKKLVKEAKGKA